MYTLSCIFPILYFKTSLLCHILQPICIFPYLASTSISYSQSHNLLDQFSSTLYVEENCIISSISYPILYFLTFSFYPLSHIFYIIFSKPSYLFHILYSISFILYSLFFVLEHLSPVQLSAILYLPISLLLFILFRLLLYALYISFSGICVLSPILYPLPCPLFTVPYMLFSILSDMPYTPFFIPYISSSIF